MPPAGGVAGIGEVPDRPTAAASGPLRPRVVIAAAAILALALRLFQLSRPGYLSGFTQYDDGVYFGNALRLVHGAIAYRDFAMVQPPGSMLLAGLTAGSSARARRDRAWFAGGFAAGLAVPCLPFLVLAPSGFGRTVFVSELVQSTHGRFGPRLRLADITGLTGLISLTRGSVGLDAAAFSVVIGLLIAVAWLLIASGGLTALDRYVLAGVIVATVMMFVPSEWYEHYAAFDGPFVVLAVALPIARLAAVGWSKAPRAPRAAGPVAGTAAALVIAVLTLASVSASVRQAPVRSYAVAGRIIPPGACVVTDTASATIAVDRFTATSPGCPQLVDSLGTLIATTRGQDLTGARATLAPDTSAWQEAFSRAQYVWLIGNGGNTGERIAWTWSLFGYFDRHFGLLKFASGFRGKGDVPGGGLYVRT
jgi:hypothetical protein